MRLSLAPLRGRRARFAARFAGVSKTGHIILEDLQGPGGREPYIWVAFREWHSRIRLPGEEVHFSARIVEYFRDHDNTRDLCLKDLQIEEA